MINMSSNAGFDLERGSIIIETDVIARIAGYIATGCYGVVGMAYRSKSDEFASLLKKDSLIGSIIVGTGLPSISTENSILKTFYDEKENKGYEYAYVYPGMNKVLQAAGRVIRTDKDRGVIALLDDRFLNRQYQSLFPLEWEDYRIVDIKGIEQEVLDFWGD